MNLPPKQKLIAIIAGVVILVVLVIIGVSRLKDRKTQRQIQEGLSALDGIDWDQALQLFTLVSKREPNHPDVIFGIAKARLELTRSEMLRGQRTYKNKLQQQESKLNQLIQTNNNRAEAWMVKGDVKYYLEKYSESLEAYQQAQRKSNNSAESILGVGKSLFALSENDPNQIAGAINSLLQAIQQRSKNETALRMLVELRLRQMNTQEALPQVETLQQMNNLEGKSLNTLGKFYYYLGNYEKAKELLEQARTKIKGAFDEATLVENRFYLGTTYFVTNDFEEAQKHLKQARKSAQKLKVIYPQVQLAQLLVFESLIEPDETVQDRKVKNAIKSLQDALKNDPVNPMLHYLLAQTYIRMENDTEAKGILNRLVRAHPDHLPGRFDLANILHRQGEDQLAIPHYEKVLAGAPTFNRANFNLGTLYLKRAAYSEAIEYLSQAVQNDPSLMDARLNLAQSYLGVNDFASAKAQYEEILANDESEIRAINGLGTIYRQEGDLQKAEAQFQKTIDKAPTHEEAYLLLSQLYVQQGDLKNAIRKLERVRELNPANLSALIQLGNAYVETKERSSLSKAKDLFENLRTNSSQAIVRDALQGLALAYLTEENFPKAKEIFDEILLLPHLSTKEQAQIYVNIGNAYLKQKQIDLAKGNYEAALKLDGGMAEAYYNLGRLHHLHQQFSEAQRMYRLAFSSDPTLAEARYNIGVLLEQRGNLKQAIKTYTETISIDSSLTESYLNLANLFQRENQTEQALELLLKAKNRDPNSKLIRDALAGIYYRQNQFDKAKIELDYPNPTAQAYQLRGMLAYHDELYPEAIKQFRQALLQEGAEARFNTLSNLGAALLKMENPDAEEYLNQALAKNRRSTQVLNNLTTLYIQTGRYEDAFDKLERSLGIEPEQPSILALQEQLKNLN